MKVGKFLIVFVSVLGILVFCVMLYQALINNNDVNNVDTNNVDTNIAQVQNNVQENVQNNIVVNNEILGNVIEIEQKEFVIGERTALFTEESYPRIDGSTATIPLSEAFKAEFLAKDLKDVSVTHNKTHNAYENLIKGKADLILVTYPSADELKMAKDAGIELEIIPVVNEAFVFYTNEKNPVKNLTFEQIQKIYTGEITNWSEVGGDNAEITAYQRQPNSGSQSGMLELVMKDKKMMEAPKENVIADMSSIIGLVSDYENGQNSIGYSYYYYATTMYDTIDKEVADRIQLLGVNGVEPNNTTIKNGTYPIRTNYYIVINKAEKEDSDTRKLVNAMLGERGQQAAEAVGYVGM